MNLFTRQVSLNNIDQSREGGVYTEIKSKDGVISLHLKTIRHQLIEHIWAAGSCDNIKQCMPHECSIKKEFTESRVHPTLRQG